MNPLMPEYSHVKRSYSSMPKWHFEVTVQQLKLKMVSTQVLLTLMECDHLGERTLDSEDDPYSGCSNVSQIP